MKNWIIEEKEYNADKQGYYETIFTLTNGYMGIRGNLEGSKRFFLKGTFISGVFDKGEAQVVEIVNCPGFSDMDISIDDELISIDECSILSHRRVLDMKDGFLFRDTVFEDRKGRKTRLEIKRLLSIYDPHLYVMEIGITPLNFSSRIKIASYIDGNIENSEKNSSKKIKHYTVDNVNFSKGEMGILKAATTDNGTEVISGFIMAPRNFNAYDRNILLMGNMVHGEISFNADQNRTVIIDKIVSTYTSGDADDVAGAVFKHLEMNKDIPFEEHLKRHAAIIRHKWEISDVVIEGDDDAQLAVRYNIFNLMCLGSNLSGNTSIGAKGLHGESYKGHVFWDTESFMLPFFIYSSPENAKKLLMYRYNRLHAAGKNAVENGCKGAQFPWESADTGLETTPKTVYLPDGTPIRCWTGDEEIHVSSDVAFAFFEYYTVTNDREFFLKYGAEVIFDVARYWSSRAVYNNERNFYEIKSVIGPDEFHIHVNNNYYTNYMAKWVLLKAWEIYHEFGESGWASLNRIKNSMKINDEEVEKWGYVGRNMYLKDDSNVIEQFDGYFELKDYIIEKYSEKGMPILPPNLKNEPDFEGYQLIKQADVVLILHLFNDRFSEKIKRMNYEYYEKRTTHLSSLSASTYCLMGIDAGKRDMAYKYFNLSSRVDIDDSQGTAKEGIHAASLGGTWQSVIMGFGGFRLTDGGIKLSPWLPAQWKRLKYNVLWREDIISVDITDGLVKLFIKGNKTREHSIRIFDKIYNISSNQETVIKIKEFQK